MGKIVSHKKDVIQAELAKELLKLSFQEMTKSKVILRTCTVFYNGAYVKDLPSYVHKQDLS
jgi:hypothetical protein